MNTFGKWSITYFEALRQLHLVTLLRFAISVREIRIWYNLTKLPVSLGLCFEPELLYPHRVGSTLKLTHAIQPEEVVKVKVSYIVVQV